MLRRLALPLAVIAGFVVILIPGRGPDPGSRALREDRPAAVRVTASRGGAPRFVVHDFVAESPDPGLPDIARTISEVLWQDLDFEGAFELLPQNAISTMPVPRAPASAPLTGWQHLGADGLLTGVVRKYGEMIDVEVRLFVVATGELAFGRAYAGPAASARGVAHSIAEELLLAQAGLTSVSRTRLAFVSDRGGTFRELGGRIRRFKEIYVADYDGANQRPLTFDRDLDMTPSWSPDGTAIAYTSFRRGFQDILISPIDGSGVESPTRGYGKNWLPAWSPEGTRLAFTSNRDGNEEVYVANRDGSGLQRLTRHPAIDTSPAWSSDGTRLAFTSNRTGRPQIWVMDADGANQRELTAEKYCDRPTWAPPPHNEIAYVSQTRTGFDIKVIDVATGDQRQLTFGEGFNESPAWAPSGRHLAFSSTRHGGQQVWTMTSTGRGLRQVTSIGNNTMPAWSR